MVQGVNVHPQLPHAPAGHDAAERTTGRFGMTREGVVPEPRWAGAAGMTDVLPKCLEIDRPRLFERSLDGAGDARR